MAFMSQAFIQVCSWSCPACSLAIHIEMLLTDFYMLIVGKAGSRSWRGSHRVRTRLPSRPVHALYALNMV